MPGHRKPALVAKSVGGLKYFKRLQPLFDRLRDIGTDNDHAGNRQLHFDQYASLILLYFFNPCLTSLRGIQKASDLKLQLYNVLTPDQKAQLSKQMAAWKARMAERMAQRADGAKGPPAPANR